jgi:hypothetical protein
MKSIWERLSLAWILFLLISIGLGGFILLSSDARILSGISATARADLASKLLELAIISVGGVVLTLLTFEYQQRRQKSDATGELLRDAFGRLLSAYNRTKGIRRMLRARFNKSQTIGRADYDLYLERLSDAQLEFERVKRDTEPMVDLAAWATIHSVAETIEQYLNEIVSEYEKNRHLIGTEGYQLPLLPKLHGFIHEDKSAFRKEFADQVRQARKNLSADLRC